MRGFSNSDWAGDQNDQKCITGYRVYFMDYLVAWKSRTQKNVTLSSSKVEYVAVSVIFGKFKFTKMIYINIYIYIASKVGKNNKNVL